MFFYITISYTTDTILRVGLLRPSQKVGSAPLTQSYLNAASLAAGNFFDWKPRSIFDSKALCRVFLHYHSILPVYVRKKITYEFGSTSKRPYEFGSTYKRPYEFGNTYECTYEPTYKFWSKYKCTYEFGSTYKRTYKRLYVRFLARTLYEGGGRGEKISSFGLSFYMSKVTSWASKTGC